MTDFAKILGSTDSLPMAFVDLDAFDRNTAKVAAQIKGTQTIRVASKSVRVPALLRRILDSGHPFKGLMTFSAFETLDLAKDGFDDFLIAYPIATEAEKKALQAILALKKKLRVIVDSPEHLRFLKDLDLEVVFEIDLSLRILGQHLGVRRSPLRTPEQVWTFYQELKNYPKLKFAGVMGYEAQVAGLGDENPFSKALNPIKKWVRLTSVRHSAQLRSQIFELFKSNGVGIELFNGGGTGSLNFCNAETCLTEMTAGSAWFSPTLFDYYSNIRFEPSCFFALSAVRSSDTGFATLQGGGYIASGEPGWDRVPQPYWPKNLKLVSTEGCGEVQTPVQGGDLKLGSSVVFRHAKAGELMERFNSVSLFQKGSLKEKTPTYRGLGRSYF